MKSKLTMKKKVLLMLLFSLMVSTISAQLPGLSRKEIKDGWVLLFDGETSNGWKRANGDPFPENGWRIENGVISVDPSQGRSGDIVTQNEYSDFELSLEFKLEKGANSGIKYFVFKNSSLGLEFQILDDNNHPDASQGRNGNRVQGSLYDIMPPLSTKKDMPPGKWNHARIISRGKHVEHWLNGKKILSFERGGEEFVRMVSGSKFKDREDFGLIEKSPILLQDHGDVVYFRNIKIKELR
jgi:hypothetical protein